MKSSTIVFDGGANLNGRIYHKDCLSKPIKDFNDKKDISYGEISPLLDNSLVAFDRVSHTIDSIFKKHKRLPRKLKKKKKKSGTYGSWKIDNSKYFANITLLDTLGGNEAKSILSNMATGLSSRDFCVKPRGFGIVDDGVIDNFDIISFDIFPKE